MALLAYARGLDPVPRPRTATARTAQPKMHRVRRQAALPVCDRIRIVAPAMAESEPAMAAPKRRRTRKRRRRSTCTMRTDHHAFWLEHVSGLSRADYAERHGLELRSLH